MNGTNKLQKVEKNSGLMAQINNDKKKRFYINLKIILLIISTNGLVYTWSENSSSVNLKNNPISKQITHKDYNFITIPAQSLMTQDDNQTTLVSVINDAKQVVFYDAYLNQEIKTENSITNDNHFFKIEIPNAETIKLSLILNQKLIIVPHINRPLFTNLSTTNENQYEINI